MVTNEAGECVVVFCKCGGWIMVAALGWGHDHEHMREAVALVKKGYAMRTPVPTEEFRAMPSCKYRGDCTTNPERVAAKQEAARVEQEALSL